MKLKLKETNQEGTIIVEAPNVDLTDALSV